MEFDLQSLSTLGAFNYGGDRFPGVLTTAHPHFDPKSGSLLNFVTEMGLRNRYIFYRIPPGQKRRERMGSIPVRQPAYMHSFGITENYLILAEFPLVVNPLRLVLRDKPIVENYEWKPERGTRLFAMSKRDGSLRTWTAEAFFAFHHVNAFEQNGDLVFDIAAYDDASLMDALCLERLRAGGPIPASQFRRYRLPARGSTAEYEALSSESIELPRLNYEQGSARDYRFAYGVSNRPDRPGDLYNQLVKVDVCERTAKVWLAEGCYVGEPVFAASPGTAGEDDGVIFSVVLDAAAGTSFLLLLDAHSFTEIARLEVPIHIPFGFHGQYFAN
jgi:carotenoid cleavage dioxygenase-like enzyme